MADLKAIFSKPTPRLFALLVALWAAIYLPGLGGPELKGEEGRRILPALTMMQTGDWLVPSLGGRDYLRKPPLVNWLIAGSIHLFGKNEMAARLPSTLALLAVALVIVGLGRGQGWMNAETAMVAALLMLTAVGALDKGRLAEIEPVYLGLGGIAIVLWLAGFARGVSPWRLWLWPALFLGLGLLAKAPLHLLYFYAIVVCVALYVKQVTPLRWIWPVVWLLLAAALIAWAVPHWQQGSPALWEMVKSGLTPPLWALYHKVFGAIVKLAVAAMAGIGVCWTVPRLRFLLHPAHLVMIAVAAGVFAAWFVPFLKLEPQALKTLIDQSVGRVTGALDWTGYALNIPRALQDSLPWVLFAPLLWRRDLSALGPRLSAVFRGTRLAVLLCFFGLLLVPGSLPRYVIPLLVPASCLYAFVLVDERLVPPARSLRAWWTVNGYLGIFITLAGLLGPVIMALLDRYHYLPSAPRNSSEYLLQPGPVLWASASAFAMGLAVLRGHDRLARPVFLACSTAGLVAAGLWLFAGFGVPVLNRKDNLRYHADRIDTLIGPGQSLAVYDPDYMPMLFYLRAPFQYAPVETAIPLGTRWVLSRAERSDRLLTNRPEYRTFTVSFPRLKPNPVILMRLIEVPTGPAILLPDNPAAAPVPAPPAAKAPPAVTPMLATPAPRLLENK